MCTFVHMYKNVKLNVYILCTNVYLCYKCVHFLQKILDKKVRELKYLSYQYFQYIFIVLKLIKPFSTMRAHFCCCSKTVSTLMNFKMLRFAFQFSNRPSQRQ